MTMPHRVPRVCGCGYTIAAGARCMCERRSNSPRQLRWHDDGDGLVLCRGQAVLLHIVPDDRLPGMWRVLHDGRLSAVSPIGRAKRLAMSLAVQDGG
jgi:hypothetical protein